MTTYRLMDGVSGRPGPNGPALTAYTATPFEAGTMLTVTQGGVWAVSYWWWVPASGDTAAQKFCLWNITGTGAGTVVPGSVVMSGTLTANAWNEITLPSPVPLAIGATYCPATAWTPGAGFPDTQNQFGSGQPYSVGITNGPLLAFADSTGGGSPGPPYGYGQGVFGTANADPTAGFPQQMSSSSNFWIDLLVSDTPPGGYSGSWRLWPNMGDALGWAPDLARNYSLGTEFLLSQACVLNKAWFYSPPGAGQLPTDVAVWDVASQTIVPGTHQASPTWSGAAGDGWISVSFSGVTLPAGDYKISVFNGNATPQVFNATTAGYFTSGPGAAGITAGPVTCPDAASASSPGQCTYADTTGSPSFAYPDLYVAGQAQNYWLDAEVTPVAIDTGSGSVRIPKLSLAGAGLGKGVATGSVRLPKMQVAATGRGKVTGTASVALHKPALSGTGREVATASGSVALPKMRLAGAGTAGEAPVRYGTTRAAVYPLAQARQGQWP